MTLRLQTRYYSVNAILTDFRLQTLHYSIYRDLPTSDFLDTILFLLRLQTKSTLVRYVLSPAKKAAQTYVMGQSSRFGCWTWVKTVEIVGQPKTWKGGSKTWKEGSKTWKSVQNLKKWVQTWKMGPKLEKVGPNFSFSPRKGRLSVSKMA